MFTSNPYNLLATAIGSDLSTRESTRKSTSSEKNQPPIRSTPSRDKKYSNDKKRPKCNKLYQVNTAQSQMQINDSDLLIHARSYNLLYTLYKNQNTPVYDDLLDLVFSS